MVLSSDHVTGATGKTVTVKLSKGPVIGTGAVFGAAAGTVTELDSSNGPGWYQVALTTVDTGTLGDLAYACTASGCDSTDFKDEVQAQVFTDLNIDTSTGRVKILNNLQQNTALNGYTFPMTSGVTGLRQTGLTVTAQRTLAGIGFAPCANSPTEIGTTGIYSINFIASDLNAGTLGILLTATGANDLYIPITPTP